MGYSFRLAVRALLYAPSHRQDSTCHGLCYTSRRVRLDLNNKFDGIYSLPHTRAHTHTIQIVHERERGAIHERIHEHSLENIST